MEEKKWWQSSAHEGIALTLKGSAMAIIPLAVLIAGQLGVDITTNELTEAADAVIAVVSTLMIAAGIVRKLYYKFKKQ